MRFFDQLVPGHRIRNKVRPNDLIYEVLSAEKKTAPERDRMTGAIIPGKYIDVSVAEFNLYVSNGGPEKFVKRMKLPWQLIDKEYEFCPSVSN